MEYEVSENIREQSHMELTLKKELEEAARSAAHIVIEIDMNPIKDEPGLGQFVEREPALLVKEEILEDSSQGAYEQQRVPATSTCAVLNRTSTAADAVKQGELLNLKKELEDTDLDIEPTVLQQVDSHYRTNQPNLNGIKQENTVFNLEPGKVFSIIEDSQVKDKTSESNWKGSSVPYVCDYCPKKFRWKSGLVAHLQNMQGCKSYKCEVCQENFVCRLNLSKHIKQIHSSGEFEGQHYKCVVCRKVYKSKKSLYVHNKRVHATESLKCTQCDKEFKCKLYLLKHVRYTHNEEQAECDICKKICNSKAALYNHVVFYHRKRLAGIIKRCDLCPKMFHSRLSLKRHCEQTHSISLTKCTECNMQFKSKNYLNTHVRRVHFECDICKEMCKSEHALSDHVLKHTPTVTGQHTQIYTCDLCRKTFWKKGGIQKHIVTVHATGAHRCVKCNTNYKCYKYLHQHERLIHGKAKYKCELCPRHFNARYRLTNHCKSVHSSKSIPLNPNVEQRKKHGSTPTAAEISAVATTSAQLQNVKSETADQELDSTPVVLKTRKKYGLTVAS